MAKSLPPRREDVGKRGRRKPPVVITGEIVKYSSHPFIRRGHVDA